MSDTEKTNDYFKKRNEREISGATHVTKKFASSDKGGSLSHRDKEMVPVDNIQNVKIPKTGLFASKEEKEATKLVQEGGVEIIKTNLQLLKNQCNAALKEDKAYWDGKSTEVAKKIEAYVSQSIQNVEVERSENTMKATSNIVNIANNELRKIASDDDMIDALKDKLVDRIFEEMDKSIEVIKQEDRTSNS